MTDNNTIFFGSIWKEMSIFALPIFLSYLFQNLYNSVDSLIVGNVISKHALAAVSNCSTVTNIMVGFFTGLSSGAMTIFSRYFGAKDYKSLDKSVHTALMSSVIFGLIMMTVGYFSSETLLKLMKYPTDVIYHALPYLQMYFLGSVFSAVFNICSGICRSFGDSKTPFYILLLTTALNVIFDLLFTVVIDLSVSGVALSTVIAQGVSAFVILNKLMKDKRYIDISFSKMVIDKIYLKEIVNQGLPAGIQTCMISLSNSLMQRYVNSFDTDIITGIGVAKKIDGFVAMPCQSFGIATATFVSRYYGCGDKKKIKESIFTAVILMSISVTALCVPITIFSDQLVKLFNKDPNVIAEGTAMIRVIAPLYIVNGFMEIFFGINRGYKKAIQVMIFSMFSMIVIRQTFLAIAFSFAHNIFFIHICYPLCWAVALLFNVIYYFGWVRKKCEVNYV